MSQVAWGNFTPTPSRNRMLQAGSEGPSLISRMTSWRKCSLVAHLPIKIKHVLLKCAVVEEETNKVAIKNIEL